MKAKDYMKRLDGIACAEDAVPIMTHVVNDIVKEILELMLLRKAKSGSAVLSIVNELRDKFTAFNRMATEKYGQRVLKENAFDLFIQHAIPDVWRIIEGLESKNGK